MKTPTAILICGPTASGKTGWAIQLAKRLNTVVLSADSRQCYREMNIGVARPSPEELAAVKHHFIASHSVTEELNAAWYEQYALQVASEVFKQSPYLVVVGGTGLYLKAFSEGLDAIPEVDPLIRQSVREGYEQNGLNWLQEEVKNADPLFFETGEIHNPQRMMRALEVVRSSGKSIRLFQASATSKRPFNCVKIAPDWTRDALYGQINQRVDIMMETGLEAEVRSLLPFRQYNALQTVGYRELFEYFDGNCTREEAVEKIRQHTRQYAKRQLTWFRRDPEVNWIPPGEEHRFDDLIKA